MPIPPSPTHTTRAARCRFCARRPWTRLLSWRWLWAACAVALLAACRASPAAEPPTPIAAPPPDSTAAASLPAPPGVEQQVVLWAPEFFAPQEPGEAAALEAAYAQFEQAHPGVRVEVAAKAEHGDGRMLSFLLSARDVAPAALPDLVLIDTADLWQLAEARLVAPLEDSLLSASGDFFPFARQAVRYQGSVYGLPLAVDFVHTAYLPAEVDPPPATWDALLAGDAVYALPTMGFDGLASESLLLQFLAAGGELSDDGALSNVDALLALFQFLAEGRDAGVFYADPAELSGYAATAATLAGGVVALADTTATVYLPLSAGAGGASYTRPPTANGGGATVGRAWAFAVTARDDEHRELALALAQMLLQPATLDSWIQLSDRLPADRRLFANWRSGQPYHTFAARQLEDAHALPNSRLFLESSRRLQAAHAALLAGEITAQDAVQVALGTP